MLNIIFSFALASSANAAIVNSESDRLNYSNCLTDFMIEKLEAKSSNSSFRKAADSACTAERTAYIAAIKKDEVEFGSSEKEASEYATEEADGMLSSFTGAYEGYLSSNSRPIKEGEK